MSRPRRKGGQKLPQSEPLMRSVMSRVHCLGQQRKLRVQRPCAAQQNPAKKRTPPEVAGCPHYNDEKNTDPERAGRVVRPVYGKGANAVPERKNGSRHARSQRNASEAAGTKKGWGASVVTPVSMSGTVGPQKRKPAGEQGEKMGKTISLRE